MLNRVKEQKNRSSLAMFLTSSSILPTLVSIAGGAGEVEVVMAVAEARRPRGKGLGVSGPSSTAGKGVELWAGTPGELSLDAPPPDDAAAALSRSLTGCCGLTVGLTCDTFGVRQSPSAPGADSPTPSSPGFMTDL